MSRKSRRHRDESAWKQKQRRRGSRLTPGRLARLGAVAAAAVAAIVFVGFQVIGGDDTGGGSAGAFSEEAGVINGPTAEAYQGGARLHLPVTEVNFGHVPLGKEVSYAFDLVNVGDAPLTIKGAAVKVIKGCCPFQPVLASTTIQPGEKTTLSLKTHMMKGMDGPHLFEIDVTSNDGVSSSQKLYVRGDFSD